MALMRHCFCAKNVEKCHSVAAFSADEFFGDVVIPTHVGEAHLAAFEEERELAMVQAEKAQDGGVEVVDVEGVVDGTEADFIRCAVDLAALDAAPGKPGGEA